MAALVSASTLLGAVKLHRGGAPGVAYDSWLACVDTVHCSERAGGACDHNRDGARGHGKDVGLAAWKHSARPPALPCIAASTKTARKHPGGDASCQTAAAPTRRIPAFPARITVCTLHRCVPTPTPAAPAGQDKHVCQPAAVPQPHRVRPQDCRAAGGEAGQCCRVVLASPCLPQPGAIAGRERSAGCRAACNMQQTVLFASGASLCAECCPRPSLPVLPGRACAAFSRVGARSGRGRAQ